MHTYERSEAAADGKLPDLETYRFNDALDVVAWASVDHTIGWATWPEVWHLDGDGRFQCYFKASSGDSIRRWANDPSSLFRSRAEGRRTRGCANRWLIVESRPRWLHDDTINEEDARAFLATRSHLAGIGVHLVDAVIFDDARHWWSLHEVTTGDTAW